MKPPPTTLEQWSKGRSNFTATVAPLLLASANALAYYCQTAARQTAVGAILKQCSAREWVGFYRGSKGLFVELLDLLEREHEMTPNMRCLLAIWLRLRGLAGGSEGGDKQEPEKVEPGTLSEAAEVGARIGAQTTKEAQESVRGMFRDWRAMLGSVNAKRAAADDSPPPPVPLLFFLLVWLPCGILYQATPARLLFRARHGDVEALGMLLRLDKLLLEEPRCRKVYYAALASRDFKARRGFQKALVGKPPTADMRVDRIKKRLAALVQKWSGQAADGFRQLGVGQFAKTSVSVPDTQRLLDVMARERGDGTRDADLPLDIHTWDVAVRREHRVWPDLGKSHKTEF